MTMKPELNSPEQSMRKALLVLALCGSLIVLLMLHFENASSTVIILTLASYLIWLLAAEGLLLPASPDTKDTQIFPSLEHTVENYYSRLQANIHFAWPRLQKEQEQASQVLLRVASALDHAAEVADTTELLAANTLAAAAEFGETGQAFAPAANSLMLIGKQSRKDLQQLQVLVRHLLTLLQGNPGLAAHSLNGWVTLQGRLPQSELHNLYTGIRHFQREASLIRNRYARTRVTDVRWLQMGDAIRRILAELLDRLQHLESQVLDVLADIHLLQMAQENMAQIVEIKDRSAVNTEVVMEHQKIMP